MEKVKRSYLAHYLDAAFDMTFSKTNYVLIGDELEEFNVELNPEIDATPNILDELNVEHNGYQVSADADPFYYKYNDELSEKILGIAMDRLSGKDCRTSYVEVILKPGENGGKPIVDKAWREEVVIVPNRYGGGSSGVQVPFTIHHTNKRVKGSFDLETKTFTENGAA